MMHGDSRVMVVVCLATTSLPAPCLSNFHFPRIPRRTFYGFHWAQGSRAIRGSAFSLLVDTCL